MFSPIMAPPDLMVVVRRPLTPALSPAYRGEGEAAGTPTANKIAFPFRLLLAVALTALPGCGYDQAGAPPHSTVGGYQWRSLYREDIRTVAVPIFTNRTFRRNLEFRL